MWNNLSIYILPVILLILMPQILYGIENDTNKATLQLVQILFRHGDRNILTSYPTDPNYLESNWPEGYGQLTNVGKKQLYEFGEYLRDRYDDYLDKTYFVEDTFVWSSDNDRTIMSAMAALAGLYPPIIGDQEWNSITNFQIVPVHTIPTNVDRFLHTERISCPNFFNIVKSFIKNSKYMKDLNQESKDIFKYINTYSGLKIHFVNDILYKFHDTLYIQELRNMTIPTWAESLMEPNSEFKKIVKKCYTAFSLTPELRRLYSGELLKEILNNMKDKVNGKSQLRLVMYSGHDLTITNLMNTMGIYNHEIPSYGTSLIFELHKISTGDGDSSKSQLEHYVVKILYRNDTNEEPYVMEIQDCGLESGTLCELTKLEELMSSSISDDWEEECHRKVPSKSSSVTAAVAMDVNNLGFVCLPNLSLMNLMMSVYLWIYSVLGYRR